MNILITGGAGYIGSVITEHCLNNEHRVFIIDDLSTGNVVLINHRAKYLKCDIRKFKDLKSIFSKYQFDLVIHFAAKTRVSESVQKSSLYFDVNVQATKNIIQLMKQYQCKKIIFASSAAVYGVPKHLPLKENDRKIPVNPYGQTKLDCEKIIINSKLTYAILRFANVSGASDSLKYGMIQKQPSLLIPILNRLLMKHQVPKIYGHKYKTKDGTALRDYIHVEDVATICNLSIKRIQSNKSIIVNVCSNKGYTVLDVVSMACKIHNQKLRYMCEDNRAGDPDKLILDNSNLKKILNFSPKYSLRQMIESDYKFILKHLNTLK